MEAKPVGAYPNNGMLEEQDIEESWIFDGVFPTSLPYDALQSDISTTESVQLSVTFSFDCYPLRSSEGATEKCLAMYKTLGGTNSSWSLLHTYDKFIAGQQNPMSGTGPTQ